MDTKKEHPAYNKKLIKKLFPQHRMKFHPDYFLLHLSKIANKVIRVHNKELVLQENPHLSIYREITDLGPFHFTASDGTIDVRAFFDCYANYLYCSAQVKETNEFLVLSPEEQENIKKISIVYVQQAIIKILQEVEVRYKESKQKLLKSLATLEAVSKQGVTTLAFHQLLCTTINEIDEVNQYSFFSEYAVLKKILVSHKKLYVPAPPVSQAIPPTPEPVQEPQIEEKEVDVVVEAAAIKNTEEEIERQWLDAEAQGIIYALNLTKKAQELEKTRCDLLIQACENNDLPTVALLFNEKDIYLMSKLITTTLKAGHSEVFSWLSDKMKFMYPMNAAYSVLLNTACHLGAQGNKGYFEIFSRILKSHHPDIIDPTGLPILTRCFRDNRLDYARAALEAQANPDIVTPPFKRTVLKTVKLEIESKEEAPLAGYTPLHYAVRNRNMAAITLLEEFNASFTAEHRSANGFTPWGLALHCESHPLDLDIIKKMQEHGDFDPDERQGSMAITPLLYAVQFNNVDAVSKLLSMGANMFSKSKVGVNNQVKLMDATPLGSALMRGCDEIVEVMIAHLNTKSLLGIYKELEETYKCIPEEYMHSKMSLLTNIYYRSYVMSADHEFRQGNFKTALELYLKIQNRFQGLSVEEQGVTTYQIGCCYLGLEEKEQHPSNHSKAFLKLAEKQMKNCAALPPEVMSRRVYEFKFFKGIKTLAQESLEVIAEKQNMQSAAST